MSKVLMQSKVGLVPLNWHYEPSKMQAYLDGISGYGFRGIQISGDQAESIEFLNAMSARDIAPAEQYVAIRCDQDGPLPGSDTESMTTIRQAIAANVEMLVFAVDGTDERDRYAGRADSGPQMSMNGFMRLAAHVEEFARMAAEHGIRSSFHPHAATYVETESETRTLFAAMDSSLVGLCLDVGHWIVGGSDPIKAISDYRDRITHVHVKDVNGSVLQDLVSGSIETMNTAVEEFKLFVPAGTGLLNLRELFLALESVSFRGWLMSEQDSAWEPSEAASGISIANITAALA